MAVLVAGRASAHDITTVPPNGRQVTFVIRGQRLPFTATDWRIFAFADDTTLKQPEAPEPELVGDRPLLRRVITAQPDQLITILAERRPGSSDLFVLTVDRCPER